MSKHKLINSKEVKKIFNALDNNARFVGGCVRDILLDKDAKDIDIATPFMPDEVTELLKTNGIKVIPTGIQHGTVTAVVNKQNFEITTLRCDVSCDGRHAEVEFTDNWEEDAARRDFTINAMSCTIDGEIYDYFNGAEDLKAGIVRFVGNAEDRCREDILRILRFFRFNAYYGNVPMNKEGLLSCTRLAFKIPDLSGERIQAEMIKLLSAPDPTEILRIMAGNSVTKYLSLEHIDLIALKNLIAIETKLKLAINPILRLATLIQDNPTNLTKMWRLSNKDKKLLTYLVAPPVQFDLSMNLSEQRKILRKTDKKIFSFITIMKWAEESTEENDELYKDILNKTKSCNIPVFPISGKDLQAIGIKPGKAMGNILKQAETWWEEGGYKASGEEILEFVKLLH